MLHMAAGQGRPSLVRFLLRHGARVDGAAHAGRPQSPWTPLHNAAETGAVAVAEALLDAGEITGSVRPMRCAGKCGAAWGILRSGWLELLSGCDAGKWCQRECGVGQWLLSICWLGHASFGGTVRGAQPLGATATHAAWLFMSAGLSRLQGHFILYCKLQQLRLVCTATGPLQ